MPTVSIIIPNYNHAQYLKQRIDSVLSQTFQDFEVIILDDCSPDDSKEVIEAYRGHPKVAHIIYNDTNSGSTFKQWEKGLELAKGEWIWIAESDDWCEPLFLETVLDNTDDHTSLSFAQTYICTENTGNYYGNYSGTGLQAIQDGREFVKTNMLPYNGIWNASQAIFRKAYFYKISAKYLEFKFCGDWIFWIEIAILGNVGISGKFLSYFRKHDADVTSKVSKSGLRFFEEVAALQYFKSILASYLEWEIYFKVHFYRIYQQRKNLKKTDFKQLTKIYSQYLPLSFSIKLKGESILRNH